MFPKTFQEVLVCIGGRPDFFHISRDLTQRNGGTGRKRRYRRHHRCAGGTDLHICANPKKEPLSQQLSLLRVRGGPSSRAAKKITERDELVSVIVKTLKGIKKQEEEDGEEGEVEL